MSLASCVCCDVQCGVAGSCTLPLLAFSRDLAENLQFLKLLELLICHATQCSCFICLLWCYYVKTILEVAFQVIHCIEKQFSEVRSILVDIDQAGGRHLQQDTDLAIEVWSKCLVKHTYILFL